MLKPGRLFDLVVLRAVLVALAFTAQFAGRSPLLGR
jgi:hypothetical protein